MDAVGAVLRRLRGWFTVWFIGEAVVGTATAAYVVDGMRRHTLLRYATGGLNADATIAAGILGSVMVFLLAWAVLEALIDLHAWARVVLLVFGWITVVSAILNLLMLPGSSALLEPVVEVTGGDWPTLAAASVLTKTLDVAFWSWAIYTLQLDPAVRGAFLQASRDAGHRAPGSDATVHRRA